MSELKVNTITAAGVGQNLVLQGGVASDDGTMPAGAVTLPAGSMIEPVGGGEPTPLGGGGGGGAWNVIGSTTFDATNDDASSVTITGIDSEYDIYCIGVSNIAGGATQGGMIEMRVGDSNNGIRADNFYDWRLEKSETANAMASTYNRGVNQTEFILTSGSIGTNTTPHTMGCMIYMYGAANGNNNTVFAGQSVFANNASAKGSTFHGKYDAQVPFIIDRIQIRSNAPITAGRVTVWGVSHA